jgi:preprotein translocase subunit SecY
LNNQEMLNPKNEKTGRCARWCALVVLVAVCALTVSVATRYTAPGESGISTTHTVSKHAGPASSRQRLDLNAAGWTPPVIDSAVLQTPRHAKVIPAQPTVLKLFPESSLYNRPPPSV